MKLVFAQIAGFLAAPDPRVRVILLYGPDAGLVRERADNLARKFVKDPLDPFCVTLLTGNSVNDDPARLYDEAAAMAFGGGKRLVRVQHALEGTGTALTPFLASPPSNDSLILIEAGDLEKKSKLRALCESDGPLVCAIPCYVEDSAQRQRTIAEILKAENLTAPRELLQHLADSLPPDRIALRSEVEKLALYAKGQTQITLEDIQAVLQHAGAAVLDDFLNAVATGEVKRAAVLLDHLWAEQTSPVALLRAAQRHFLRLQLARAHVDGGASPAEAIKKLQPAVFWKHVDSMNKQVQRWTSPHLALFLQRLAEAEASSKRTGTPDTALCGQLFLQTAGR